MATRTMTSRTTINAGTTTKTFRITIRITNKIIKTARKKIM